MSETITTEPSAPASLADRVAARAADVRFARLILSLLALPFYLLGLIVGLLVLAARWCYAAVIVGVADVTKRSAADAG